MKKLTCTQCGATINSKTLTCEYCGSVYLNSNAEPETKENKRKAKTELQFDVRELDNNELARLIKSSATGNSGFVFVIIFMLVWTSVAIGMLTTVLSEFGDMGGFFPSFPFVIVTGFFAILGISVIIKVISQMLHGKIDKEIAMVKNGEFEKARQSLIKREEKKHHANFVSSIILIDYFKLANYSEAKKLIIQMKPTELASIINYSSVFIEISQNLNIKSPTFNTQYTSMTHTDGNGGYTVTF